MYKFACGFRNSSGCLKNMTRDRNRAAVVALFEPGKTVTEIVKKLKMYPKTVYRIVQNYQQLYS